MASLANSPKPVQAADLLAPNILEKRVSVAAASATRSAEAFTRMRDELAGALGEAIVELLDAEQYSLLNGSAPVSQELHRRFRTLQLEGLELSRRVADGESQLPEDAHNFTEALEDLARDLAAHLAQVKEVLTTLSPSLPSEAGSTLELILGEASDSSVAIAPTEDENDASTNLARLNVVARKLADKGDSSMLSEARRLGARFAREATEDDFRQLVREILARAEKRLKFASSGKQRPEKNLQRRANPSTSFTWRPGSVCTIDDVNSASENFDVAVREFRGPLMKALLPPEVENLHRVIHTMQVMKSALLMELSHDSETKLQSHDDVSQSSLVASCQKYFAGVGQIENDINHYKGLLRQQKQKRRKTKQRGKTESTVPKKRPALSALRF